MINEDALRDTLLAFTEIAKRQYELIVSSMVELSALRETIHGLDPTFDDTLAKKREEALQNSLPSMRGLAAILDGLTRKLKSGDVC